MTPEMEKRKTSFCGLGVFTLEDINCGSLIMTLTGKPLKHHECVEMVKMGTMNNDNPLQVGYDDCLMLDEFPNLFNHSCDPNAAIRGYNSLYAVKDIKKGEEIRYDYSLTVSPLFNTVDDWLMECHCGSSNCRKKIGHILTIHPEQLKFCISNDMVPDYMIEFLHRFCLTVINSLTTFKAK